MNEILEKIEARCQLVSVHYSDGVWDAECSHGKDDYITDDYETAEEAVVALYQLVKHLIEIDNYQFDDEVPF